MRALLLGLVLLLACSQEVPVMSVTSSFSDHIPPRYTCDGADVNPPFSFGGFPAGTVSLALIVDDPDAPKGPWVHWLVWNIPPGGIAEDSVPGIEGTNSWGRQSWGGPCPPRGEHHYHFRVYALDTMLALPPGSSRAELEAAMRGHVLATGELVGRYGR